MNSHLKDLAHTALYVFCWGIVGAVFHHLGYISSEGVGYGLITAAFSYWLGRREGGGN